MIEKNSLPNQSDIQAVSKEIAIICNILAMAYLHTEDYKMCQELLKKAELYCASGNESINTNPADFDWFDFEVEPDVPYSWSVN